MEPQDLARQAVQDFNTYRAQASALGHASTDEELVKLMAMAIERAMTLERLRIVGKLLYLRDELQPGPERETVNNLANQLHY